MWWTIPGPSEVIERIASAIRDGQCVLVDRSRLTPPGLKRAVRRELDYSDRHWDSVSAEDIGEDTFSTLMSRCIPSVSRSSVLSVADFVHHEALAARLLWIDVEDAHRGDLLDFFIAFAHAANDREMYDRPILVLERVANRSSKTLPGLANALHVELNAYSDWTDIRLFAARMFRRRFSGVALDVASNVCAGLAGWDAEFVAFCHDASLAELLEPMALLSRYGSRLDVSRNDWQSGCCGCVGTEQMVHSAALALADRRLEIKHRVWRAQVGPLFTFIEERRLELIERLRDVLRVPVSTMFGPIERVEDLELSHINQQLQQRSSGRTDDSWLAYDLKQIRDKLAHLEPVTVVELSKPSLKAWWTVERY